MKVGNVIISIYNCIFVSIYLDKFSANSLTFSDSEDESDDMTVYDKKQIHRNGLSNSKIQKYMDRGF